MKRRHVYVIGTDQGSDPKVKIGTGNVPDRLQEATRWNRNARLLLAFPGGRTDEKALHRHFVAYQEGGEVFRLEGELAEWVDRLMRTPGIARRLEDLGSSYSPPSVMPWERIESRQEIDGQGVLAIDIDWTATPSDSVVSTDWHTPPFYTDLVRQVFGGPIDLDPASCAAANRTVGAARFFTAEVNGLHFPWEGSVWLNPPWPGGDVFVRKLLAEYRAGRVSQAVCVVSARSMTARWFQGLLEFPICLPHHRILFRGPNGKGGAPNAGHVFVYLGPNPERFSDVFVEIGHVAIRLLPARTTPDGFTGQAGMARVWSEA